MAKKRYEIVLNTKKERKTVKSCYENVIEHGDKYIESIEKSGKKSLMLTTKKNYSEKDVIDDLYCMPLESYDGTELAKKEDSEAKLLLGEKKNKHHKFKPIKGAYYVVYNAPQDYRILVFAKDIEKSIKIALRYFKEEGIPAKKSAIVSREMTEDSIGYFNEDYVVHGFNNKIEISADEVANALVVDRQIINPIDYIAPTVWNMGYES